MYNEYEVTVPVDEIRAAQREMLAATRQHILGSEALIEQIFIGILTGGHVLVEGLPGTAKTTIGKIVAKLMGYDFSRVQGAVDVQPADIIGIRIYDPEQKAFILRKGPIFHNFIMIDEINRLTPKTQSAFLEAMSERQTTIDGVTYPLAEPYFALATQNTYDAEGTFPLIQVQKDRFMFSILTAYLDADTELELLNQSQEGNLDWFRYQKQIHPVLNPEKILAMQEAVRRIYVDETILQYIRDLVFATRTHEDIRLGASPRASIGMLAGAKAKAALDGREYVIPDDVKAMALPVFRHRIALSWEAEIGHTMPEEIVTAILATTEVP
ncbi:MAG: MoxR family ATPase [Methanoculleus marisnigri]|nr:MoxR family ATPase [Methanoculleus marisnigri]